jgi:ribosomal silencing factor RsfS
VLGLFNCIMDHKNCLCLDIGDHVHNKSRNTVQSECYFIVVQMESEIHFEAICDEVGNQINKWNEE